jgi:hypothetical protein
LRPLVPGGAIRDDRAEIEDLLARYVFALDWQDPERYGSTFTTDGVLVWAGGTVTSRAAIVEEIRKARAADTDRRASEPPARPWRRPGMPLPNWPARTWAPDRVASRRSSSTWA